MAWRARRALGGSWRRTTMPVFLTVWHTSQPNPRDGRMCRMLRHQLASRDRHWQQYDRRVAVYDHATHQRTGRGVGASASSSAVCGTLDRDHPAHPLRVHAHPLAGGHEFVGVGARCARKASSLIGAVGLLWSTPTAFSLRRPRLPNHGGGGGGGGRGSARGTGEQIKPSSKYPKGVGVSIQGSVDFTNGVDLYL